MVDVEEDNSSYVIEEAIKGGGTALLCKHNYKRINKIFGGIAVRFWPAKVPQRSTK